MSVIRRITGIILQPGREWEAIARESATVASVTLRYLLPLCLITPLATLIGMIHFNSEWDSLHGYSVAPEKIIGASVTNFAFMLFSVFLLAGIFHLFAPSEKPFRGTFIDALKVAAYGAAPLLLAGAGLIMPIFIIITMIAMMHSLFLYYVGIKTVLHVHELDAAPFVAVAITMLFLVSSLLGGAAVSIGILVV